MFKGLGLLGVRRIFEYFGKTIKFYCNENFMLSQPLCECVWEWWSPGKINILWLKWSIWLAWHSYQREARVSFDYTAPRVWANEVNADTLPFNWGEIFHFDVVNLRTKGIRSDVLGKWIGRMKGAWMSPFELVMWQYSNWQHYSNIR